MNKKGLYLIIFLFIPISLFAREMHGNVQFGYVPEIESFETEINLQFLPWYWLQVYGGISVLMEHNKGMSFYPYQDTYIFGTKINITKLLYIDIYHHCVHPVYSYSGQFYDKFAGGNKTRLNIGIEW